MEWLWPSSYSLFVFIAFCYLYKEARFQLSFQLYQFKHFILGTWSLWLYTYHYNNSVCYLYSCLYLSPGRSSFLAVRIDFDLLKLFRYAQKSWVIQLKSNSKAYICANPGFFTYGPIGPRSYHCSDRKANATPTLFPCTESPQCVEMHTGIELQILWYQFTS